MEDAFDEIRFPMHLFSDAKKTIIHVIEFGEIQGEEDGAKLIQVMFDFPERDFFYYTPIAAGLDSTMESLRGDISFDEYGLHYYAHPNFKHDYVRILPGDVEFEWESETRDHSQQFMRYRLALRDRKRRQMSALEAHDLTFKLKEGDLFFAKPGFFGFGMDLRVLVNRIAKLYRNKPRPADGGPPTTTTTTTGS